MKTADVAIAGGGIIGLATALELAAAGRKVAVFDRGEAMSEASRAAAGMLAGEDPENPPELRELARLSLALYPEFLARVEELSGAKIPVRTTITVQGMHHLPEGKTALSDAEVQKLAPGANTAGWSFFLMEEKSFDAWDLAEALPAAALAAGVEIGESTPVLEVQSWNGGVELMTPAGQFAAGSFLNAAGAWSAQIYGNVTQGNLPVAPQKGHMITAELPGKTQMQCVLRTSRVYIVPRGRGRYTIGPTLEDAGFNKDVHPDQIHALFQKARELWPTLRDAAVAETWTGLRPGSEDGLPIIDATGPHCWIATGHFKNGILLGPGTARAVSQWMLGSEPPLDLSPFRLARFAVSTVS
jgi:glycine oxidase